MGYKPDAFAKVLTSINDLLPAELIATLDWEDYRAESAVQWSSEKADWE